MKRHKPCVVIRQRELDDNIKWLLYLSCSRAVTEVPWIRCFREGYIFSLTRDFCAMSRWSCSAPRNAPPKLDRTMFTQDSKRTVEPHSGCLFSTPSLLVLVLLVHHQFSSNVLSFFSSSSFFDSFLSLVILLLMLQKQRDIVYLHGQQQIERNNDGRDASRHNVFNRHGILMFVCSDK